jgi:WD40 repeat protein
LPIAFSPNGTLLAAGGGDQRIRLWDLTEGREIGPRPGPSAGVGVLAFAPDTKTLIAHNWRHGTTLWESRSGRETGQLHLGTARTWGFGLSADRHTLATYVSPAKRPDKGIVLR